MRLQNLLIIFIVIALPVIIILSVYVQYQVDAANLQASYDNTFLGATYDMLSAFQLNTTNNKYSAVSDSLVRDIEASINVFSTSFATSLGMTGTSKANVMTYVPALMFTLYDGYYIYTPTVSPEDGSYEHSLKPYVYYTAQYESKTEDRKIVINYSLDNYVAVYYDNKKDNKYQSRAGYLEVIAERQNDTGIYINGEDIYYNGIKIDKDETVQKNKYSYNKNPDGTISNFSIQLENSKSQNAYNYYKEAYEFTNWYNNVIREVEPWHTDAGGIYRRYTDDLIINRDNQALSEVGSYFNDERINVIKNKITDNLIQTMETYRKKTSIEFNMPKFTEMDWNQILNNVCVVSFVQGLIVGTTTYNNYVILPSTENQQYISDKGIYYIGYNVDGNGNYVPINGGSYHRIGCPELNGDVIVRI